MSSSSPSPETTAPICLCCTDCYEGQGGDPGLAAGGNVRAFDGKVTYSQKDWKEASGFNMPFGNEVAYDNLDPSAAVGYGLGWFPHDLAPLTLQHDRVLYKEGPNQIEAYYPTSGGNYQAKYYVRSLLYSSSGYRLLDPKGRQRNFHTDGRLISFQDAYGHTGSVTYDPPVTGVLKTVKVENSPTSESWSYEYTIASSRVTDVILNVNGRQVTKRTYAYDGTGRLTSITTYINSTAGTGTPAWGTDFVDISYFTYHSGSNRLKHVLGHNAYSQIRRQYANWPSGGEDPSAYADIEYSSYDGSGRVTQAKTNGGLYTYGFTYSVNPASATSLNHWKTKTVVTQPDGSKHTLYFNRIGQLMLKQVDEQAGSSSGPVKVWYPLYQKFEEVTGRLILSAGDNAISSVSEGTQTLVTLKSMDGMLTLRSYTSGNLTSLSLKRGESTAPGSHAAITQFTRAYDDDITVSGRGGPVYFLTSESIYNDDAGTSLSTTTYANTFFNDTFQIEERTITLPLVSAGQNGFGAAAEVDEFYDQWGYLTKRVNERGTATEFDYDLPRGALIEQTEDPGSSPKLNLVTTMTVDDLGRTTRVQGPEHPVVISGTAQNVRTAQWTYYKDREEEVWNFSGYTLGGNSQIVGPVTITTEDQSPPPTVPPEDYTGWRQESRVDAKYTSAGIPAPTHSFTRSDWVRWSLQLFDKGGQLGESRLYWNIPGSGWGDQSDDYGQTLYFYDSAGRQYKVTSPGGTIDRTTFNAMGWATEVSTGTVDGGGSDNMERIQANDYDDDGNLTQSTQIVDPSSAALDRVTAYTYDWRNRRTDSVTEVEVKRASSDDWSLKTTFTFDNRNRVTKTENSYRMLPATSSSAPPAYKLSGRQEVSYDARGRQYRVRTYGVNPATGTAGAYLEDNTWYDQAGNVVRNAPAGNRSYTVNHYDAVSRLTNTYTGYLPASSSSSSSGSGNPTDVSQLIISQQTDYAYDNAGNRISTITRERYPEAVGDGELGDSANEPKARVSYVASYPDGIGRTVATANYGTDNNSTSWSRTAAPIPAPSDDILVSTTTFDAAGNATAQTDPMETVTRTEYDAANRVVKLIENYEAASSSSSSSGASTNYDTNKTSTFTYTDDSLIRTQTNENTSTGAQITEWKYNVTTAQSKIASNRLVSEIVLPLRTSSSSSGQTDNLIRYTYNAQSQVTRMTDQAGTVHNYTFDRLGRQLADNISTFGANLDNYVGALETVWDVRGLRSQALSYSALGGTLRNEVKWEYNDFGQVLKEYQEHDGAVDGSTLFVEYAYASPGSPSTANTIRQTQITYPVQGTPRQLSYAYTGIDDALSRVSSISQSGTSLAAYTYLGLDTVVKIVSAQASNTQFSLGNAANNYSGLDQFGNTAETLWTINFGASTAVQAQYGRNRLGKAVWRYDAVAHAQSVLTEDNYYWYDGLYRPFTHQRGTLNAYQTGITSPQQTENFRYDQMSNWRSYQSNQVSPAQTRVSNRLNEITGLTNPSGVIQPDYDAVGNMTVIPRPAAWAQKFDLTWDGWNRLVQVTDGATPVATYRYDADNHRCVTSTPTGSVQHYYDKESRMIDEWVGTTTPVLNREYVWGIRYWQDLLRRRRGAGLAETIYPLSDEIGIAALARLPSSGSTVTVVERYSYDAYGIIRYLNSGYTALIPNTSAYAWNYNWKTTFTNTETGLYDLTTTPYDPYLGMLVSTTAKKSRCDDENKHKYRCCPSGPINIQVRRGALNFGVVKPDRGLKGSKLKFVSFQIGVSFDNGASCACCCCEFRQALEFEQEPGKKPGEPGNNRPDHFDPDDGNIQEDRSPSGKRYGHREDEGTERKGNTPENQYRPDQKEGCRYESDDSPAVPATLTGKWIFHFMIIDVCGKEGHKTLLKSHQKLPINWDA